MRKRVGAVLIAIVVGAVLIATSCVLGPNRYYGVMSVRGNRVFIRHDRWYAVGKLPEGWETLKTKVRAAAWYNPDYRATISTDVLCESSTGDRPLSVVAGDVAAAIEDREVTDSEKFMLDERGALRERVSGSVDGVPVEMDVVVVKKNNCSFDMIAIASPEDMPAVKPIFDEFISGFHYGPSQGTQETKQRQL